jgi:hypothetical protein
MERNIKSGYVAISFYIQKKIDQGKFHHFWMYTINTEKLNVHQTK